MAYPIEIREHNQQAHLDIENEICNIKDGLLTFILRVNNGNIVDLVVMEYADARKYLKLTKVIIEEHTVAFNPQSGSGANAIRPTYSKRPDSER